MSRSAVRCWGCGTRLGWTRGGYVTPAPGTQARPADEVVYLRCPACGQERVFFIDKRVGLPLSVD